MRFEIEFTIMIMILICGFLNQIEPFKIGAYKIKLEISVSQNMTDVT